MASQDDLLLSYMKKILHEKVNIEKDQKKHVNLYVKNIIEQMTDFFKDNSKLFRGDLICVGSAYQGFKIGEANEYDYNIPLKLKSHLYAVESNPERLGFYGFNDKYKDKELTLATIPDDCQVVKRGLPPAVEESVLHDMQYSTFGFSEEPAADRGTFPRAWGSPSTSTGTPAWPSKEKPDRNRGQPQPRVVGPGYRFVTSTAGPTSADDKERLADVTFGAQGEAIPFLIRRSLHHLMVSAIRDLDLGSTVKIKKRTNWPALTLDIQEPGWFTVSVDFSPIIASANIMPYPEIPCAIPRRGKRWPSRAIMEDIKKNHPPNLVAMKPFHWQTSFAECEKHLAKYGLDGDGGCRKKAHRIMKHLNKKIWCPTTKCAVSSYMLKNILFWEWEDYPEFRDWDQDKLWIRIKSMTWRLKEALAQESLPAFFNPEINLVGQRDPWECKIAKDKVQKFLGRPIEDIVKTYNFS